MRAFLKSPLLMSLALVLLGVVTQSLQAFEHVYWNVWFKNRAHVTDNAALIVSLDDGMPLNPGSVASSNSLQAKLLADLARAGAGHIYLDAPIVAGEDSVADAALDGALRRANGSVTIVHRGKVDIGFNRSYPVESRFPLPPGTDEAVSSWSVNFLGYATSERAWQTVGGRRLPSVSVARYPVFPEALEIYPNPVFAPHSVKVIDARDVLRGAVSPELLRARDIYVTSTNDQLPTVLGHFGGGKVPAAVLDISGQTGLANGVPVKLGWLPYIAIFAITVTLGRRVRRRRAKLAIYGLLVIGMLIIPGVLREHGIITSIAPTICAMLLYGPIRSSQKWRSRVQLTSSASGLPNISAMAAEGIARSQDVIAVSVSQYEQMLASLPSELHGECARQIARRLALGAGDRQIYDNDNGHFVWLEDSKTLDSLVEHLEGLRAMFSAPLVIGGHVLDTTVHFGVDRNGEIKPISRIQSALASANEAQAKSKLYEEFGEQRLADTPWELSLHARIDEGLRNGDIWLALQPQYDFRQRRFSGAEALIRWSDPDRGMIPPDAFILQAERAGRIEAITYWVLERSIGMLGPLNQIAAPFQISVNLSARMVDHPALVHRVADIVRETGLEDCSLITFEVTETFNMTNREQAKRNLAALRAMGFRLSIDDFGTGQASLAYLAEIPSDEIKLDRRFIQAITTDRRERLIVESVIALAHSLGQEVVAEGIEDVLTLEALRKMSCDLAQGYHVARPMRLNELLDLIDLSQADANPGAIANL